MAKLKGKSLCKLVGGKVLKKDLDAYLTLIDAPKYVCTKCGRAANNKKSLCQPEKF